MQKILIAYCTNTQTTAMIAEEIAEVLRDEGLVTDIVPMAELKKLDDWSAIVLGAPVNGMRWLPEASAFTEAHARELAEKPNAIFLVSYLIHVARPSWAERIRSSLDAVKQLLHPVAVGMFSGRVDKPFPLPARLLFGIPAGTKNNLHDPAEVRRWALELANAFKDRLPKT